jgi:predicted ATPase with chaperone activity
VVGLGDKAVAESRESVRAALNASGLAMPAKRVTSISRPTLIIACVIKYLVKLCE